jgi:hypothetical protein
MINTGNANTLISMSPADYMEACSLHVSRHREYRFRGIKTGLLPDADDSKNL